jgi:cell division protein FtsB
MIIRVIAGVLLAALLALQYRLWISDDGMRDVWRLEAAIATQRQENDRLRERNLTLAAEVRDLKDGRTAIEERARSDLGMIGANETFFQVVQPDSPPAEPAAESGGTGATRTAAE